MAFTEFETSTANISGLSDRPNQNDGLSSAQLKGWFDKAGNDIKTYINDVLLEELEQTIDGDSGADNIGATAVGDGTATTVQGILEEINADATALDGAVVHKTGNEAINGIKDFKDGAYIKSFFFRNVGNAGEIIGGTAEDKLAFFSGDLKFNSDLVWTEGNDGVGSGLDADTLDGKQDADMVHKAGTETITGVKTFSASPVVPTPTADTNPATKKYVDDADASKVDIADIVNDLTTGGTAVPLSAEQGKTLKGEVDAHKGNTANPHGVTAAQVGAVPTTRTVNSKPLSSDITLSASDVGALPSTDAGDLSNLTTTEKGTIVGAINELDNLVDTNKVEFDEHNLDNRNIQNITNTPTYTESLDWLNENGLANKNYILPNGNIAGWESSNANVISYTNQIPLSIATDGTPYNGGLGYKTNTRFSTTSQAEAALAGMCITGLIPYMADQTIRIKNITASGTSSSYIVQYGISKNYIQVTSFSSKFVDDGSGTYVGSLSLPALFNGYIQICVGVIDDSTIITIDELIADEVVLIEEWVDTGIRHHDVITNCPTYVVQEANRVGNLISSKRNENSLVFAVATDFHKETNEIETEKSIIHAGQGIAEIRKKTPLDFVAFMGDYGETYNGHSFIQRSLYESSLGIPSIWLQGNHDGDGHNSGYPEGEVVNYVDAYAYIGSKNQNMVVDKNNRKRIYGYKDFDVYQIRCIYLNTTDVLDITTPYEIFASPQQVDWLANVALDFGDKTDPSEWQILFLSHAPLNWEYTVQILLTIIDAYISGLDGTVNVLSGMSAEISTPVTYAFSNLVKAEVIGFIHGHTHNYRVGTIGSHNLPTISVPQVCAGRYNTYYSTPYEAVGAEVDVNGDAIYHYKVANTPKDTSFCAFVIDREERKIHALHYGAGIDREISY